MRHSTQRSLSIPLMLLAVCGSVLAQTPLTSVPLQPYGPFYLVDVKINDRGPFKFVVDSGTTSTFVDVAVVRELGLSADSDARVAIDALTLGSARFAGVEAQVLDFDEIWGAGSPSGVLGFDLFGERLVTLDLPLQRLVVRDGALAAPDGQEILSYTLQSTDDVPGPRRVPTIEIQVAGRSLDVALNPLGFGTLALPKDLMEQFSLASEAGVIAQDKTRDGVFPILGASLDGSMAIGKHRFDNPSVFFSESFDRPSLGSGTLEAFVLTFDLGHQRVRIVRPAGRANPLVTRAAALVPQSGEGHDIRSEFNENVDRVRLMVLLSPT